MEDALAIYEGPLWISSKKSEQEVASVHIRSRFGRPHADDTPRRTDLNRRVHDALRADVEPLVPPTNLARNRVTAVVATAAPLRRRTGGGDGHLRDSLGAVAIP